MVKLLDFLGKRGSRSLFLLDVKPQKSTLICTAFFLMKTIFFAFLIFFTRGALSIAQTILCINKESSCYPFPATIMAIDRQATRTE